MSTTMSDIWIRQRPVILSPDPDPVAQLPISPLQFHRRLPDYEPTPLLDLPEVAEELKLEQILVKDETTRLGLPAFKMLGASWAIYRALAERWPALKHDWKTIDELR